METFSAYKTNYPEGQAFLGDRRKREMRGGESLPTSLPTPLCTIYSPLP